MPKSKYIQIKEEKVKKKQHVLKNGAFIEAGEKEITITPFEKLCEFFNFEQDWMNKQRENDILVVDKDGKPIINADDIEERTKKEEIFVFNLAEGIGPFGLKKDGAGNYLVSENPIEMEDMIKPEDKEKLPKKINYYSIPFDMEKNEINFLEKEENLKAETNHAIKVEELTSTRKTVVVGLTEEEHEALFFDENTKVSGSFVFKGREPWFEGPAPEAPLEDLMPEKPRPLSFGQKIWSSIVSIFNKKGSAAKQEYDRKMQVRTKAEEEYKKWREDFNENPDKSHEAYRKSKENIEKAKRMKAEAQEKVKRKIRENPNGPNAETQGMDKVNYTKEMRRVLQDNPLAGITHIVKNGINVENLGCYEKLLGNEIEGKPMTESNQEALAEYMIVHDINKKLNKDIQKSEPSWKTGEDQGTVTDFRESSDKISELKIAKKRGLRKSQMMDSKAFEEITEAFKDGINLKKIDKESKKATITESTEKLVLSLADCKKTLVNNLGTKPVGSDTVEALVKLCIFEKNEKMLDTFIKGDILAADEKVKSVWNFIDGFNIDYQEQEKIRNAMRKETPEFEAKRDESIPKDKMLEKKDQVKYNKAAKAVDEYYEILEAHPGILAVCEQFKGQKLPAQAIYSAFKGFDKNLINKREANKLKEKQSTQAIL